jgi:hypothetical protein
MTINRKNIPTYDYNNCANFLLYSNYEDAAKIDTGDRRFAIEISRAMTREPAYYEGLWHWFENGGAQHLLHFLQTRNLDKFKPFAAPPVTAAKLQMIEDSRDPVHAYLQEAFDAGDPPFQHDLVAVNEIINWLGNERNYRMTHKQLASFFRSINAEWLGQRSLRDGWRPIVWAIRNGPEWGQVGLDDLKLAWRDIGVTPITPELRSQLLGRIS